jgi:hypothetical protein
MEDFKATGHDLESHQAGSTSPHYPVSERVSASLSEGLYVYHVPDNHLGHGASFGNASVWAETKGNGDMLRLFSLERGIEMLGGMSVSFMLPFTDLSSLGRMKDDGNGDSIAAPLTAPLAYTPGQIHLHPAYQQREFILGDGLHILQTFFIPRTGFDDPAAACATVKLRNNASHTIRIVLIGCVDLHGDTPRDIEADYDRRNHVLLAWNQSAPNQVRYITGSVNPAHHWVTCDEAQIFSPTQPLPDKTCETGDLIGALQFDLTLPPQTERKIRMIVGVGLEGREEALRDLQTLRHDEDLLEKTARYYTTCIRRGDFKCPSDELTQGFQWAKANMLRPLARYPHGTAVTNNPGHSSNVVGRDTAWFTHGCDFVEPEVSCDLLRFLRDHQREDGLIPEFVNAVTGETEYWDFNINDNTPLYVTAVDHHWSVTAHPACLKDLLPSVRKAAELILSQRNRDGLVECRAQGIGVQGIAGWRNVLVQEQINGVVTELNSECYDALRSASNLMRSAGEEAEADCYEQAAEELRRKINRELIDPRTNLYVRNIDLEGRVFTQPTVDMVFPLLFHVADQRIKESVITRLFSPDFMSEGGLRALPYNSPRWDPSEHAGLLGGVWPGANWWFSMGCLGVHNRIMADALERSYSYVVKDPKTFNTVPGQFNEWCDGQTLVNRGMRLSPWAPPRFLWAGIEGLAGLRIKEEGIHIHPNLPPHWDWLQVNDLPYRGEVLSFFAVRQHDGLHLYSCHDIESEHPVHCYDEADHLTMEPLTSGMTSTMMKRDGEFLLFFASSREQLLVGPLLSHEAFSAHDSYEVWRLSSMEEEWGNIGRFKRAELDKIAVRIEPRGYALYRFHP